ncbi:MULTISPECIES: hypothetical protein [Moorena]|uniref:Uncharacterized protein n=1 Tax=Moorena producens 3L TaxID=489825 RepID=F4Y353_9CYAN|nr:MULTISPECIES: hypothetical protein [Moorena]NEQ18548.1 hypothetical protein [Moorena sp. SIO3E2]EGJ28529.1 hypothetical protein LYNGBM3L_71010 [Moorena producens 3L]NEP32175.1 hypothetical protein [Moorena sp. SIO3B2]NEP67286.1 hypothetical protein [Moorena sp. SIO3A5]NEQ05588.1 hypothetical protein [Moorena sp. SIO4E2]
MQSLVFNVFPFNLLNCTRINRTICLDLADIYWLDELADDLTSYLPFPNPYGFTLHQML